MAHSDSRSPVSPMTRRSLLAGAAAGGAWVFAGPRMAHAQATAALAKVNALIAQMTLEEKAGQLTLFGDPFRNRPVNVNPSDFNADETRMLELLRAGRVGSLFNGFGAAQGRYAQDIAMNETRLKIPLLYAADIIHGFRTVFPIPLGETASWEPDLARRTARVAAVEGGAFGIHQTYAPMVDVGRDQRWGRVAEGAGEDVHLGNVFAAARVRGFQGDDLTDPSTLLATPKHFVAYGAAEGGMDYNTTDMSEAELREVYMPPFKAAFDAGALSTMSAFNDVNGVPASGNPELLTGVLREEWGFTGFVVSDYTSERELIDHGFAADDRDAARIAILAGVDVSMQSGIYNDHLPELVRSGAVPEARVDEAVRRFLMTKVALGLFDDPYRGMDPEVQARVDGTAEHHALSRDAGRRSIVMLKNDGGLLPLPKTGKRIALIGPFAEDVDNIFGTWSIFGDKDKRVSLADGFRQVMGSGENLVIAKGSEVEAPLAGGIEAAVGVARDADIVVMAIGESSIMSGEAQSRVDIVVPPPQQALVEAIAALGKPMVILLRNGRALALEGAVKDAPSILVTWFLGSQMGASVADVVFGNYSPSGRLPVSFPNFSGQQPFYYSHKTTGRPELPGQSEYKARYRETSNVALYPFGHGLTYGQVAYAAPTVSAPTLGWDGQITVTTRVTNSGTRPVEEVVQLYVRDKVASRTRPIRELKDFQKVTLAPGQTRDVSFTLSRLQLEFLGADMAPTVEPGAFDVWACGSSSTGEKATFELVR